jgi:hypothetical protein
VICSEQGGTKELVQDFGIILKEKNEYNFELVNYDKPPPLDLTQINKKLPEKEKLGNSFDVTMDRTLQDYISFFKSY